MLGQKAVSIQEKLYGKRRLLPVAARGQYFNVLDSLQSKPVTSSLSLKGEVLLQLMKEWDKFALLRQPEVFTVLLGRQGAFTVLQ